MNAKVWCFRWRNSEAGEMVFSLCPEFPPVLARICTRPDCYPVVWIIRTFFLEANGVYIGEVQWGQPDPWGVTHLAWVKGQQVGMLQNKAKEFSLGSAPGILLLLLLISFDALFVLAAANSDLSRWTYNHSGRDPLLQEGSMRRVQSNLDQMFLLPFSGGRLILWKDHELWSPTDLESHSGSATYYPSNLT